MFIELFKSQVWKMKSYFPCELLYYSAILYCLIYMLIALSSGPGWCLRD